MLGIEYLYDVELNGINLPPIGLGLFLLETNCLDTKLDSDGLPRIGLGLFASGLNRLLFVFLIFSRKIVIELAEIWFILELPG